GAGDGALHEDARFDAWLVFIADEDERGDGQPSHLLLEVEDRRARALYVADGERGAVGGVLEEQPAELFVAARVLAAKLDARGAGGIAVERRDAVAVAGRAERRAGLPEGGRVDAAGTGGGDDEGPGHLRVLQAEVQRGSAAHREATDIGLLDAEPAQQPIEVV